MQSVKTTGRELIGGRRVTNCCRRRPTTKDGHCYTGGSLRALPSPLLIDNVFFFRPPSLSLSFLLFSFTLVSYTLLLLGESDGGLGPRHREEQAGWNGTVVSISEDVYACHQSVDWRDCASASTVSWRHRVFSPNIFYWKTTRPLDLLLKHLRISCLNILPVVRPSSFDDGFDKTKCRSRRARRLTNERERENNTFNLKREAISSSFL